MIILPRNLYGKIDSLQLFLSLFSTLYDNSTSTLKLDMNIVYLFREVMAWLVFVGF